MLTPSIIFITTIYMLCGLKKISQNEKRIVFTLGKYTTILEPGLRFIWPIFQHSYVINFKKNIDELSIELNKFPIPNEIKKNLLDQAKQNNNGGNEDQINYESVKRN